MTVSKGRSIIWAEVYAQLPWVKRLRKGKTCTGFMGHTPFKAVGVLYAKDEVLTEEELAYKRKFQCKNSARWKYEGLKPSPRFPYRPDTAGTYCWSHLYSRGIWGSMEEEDRNLKWWKKHDPEIYKIVRSRWSTDAE